METFLRDLSLAFRSLRKQPAFTLTAVLTIALGIGASTAIFSVVNAVLLRPLPYSGAARLGLVWEDMRNRNVRDFPFPPGDVFDLQTQTTLFDGFAAIQSFRQTIGGDGQESQVIRAAAVTTNLFDLLGTHVQAGRGFIAEDGVPQPQAAPAAQGQPAAPAVPRLPAIAVLSYEFWQSRYGGDRSVIGRSIEFGNGRADIVGVLAPGFELLFPPGTGVEAHPDLLIANRIDLEQGSRNNVFLRVITRLKPGVTFEQAQAQLDTLSADLRKRFALKDTSGMYLRLERMYEDLVADVRPQLVALMGAVIFVLLIACANVANLLLVRASSRERELAVRAALGGSRWRLVRQLVAETLVLAALGGVAGLWIATFGLEALVRLVPPVLPRASEVSLDGTVLLFTAALAFAAALVFGVVPAWKASRPDVMDVLRSSGRLVGQGSTRWLRHGAVVAEVALAFVLLVGAGLMVRSFIALQRVQAGFDPTGVLTFTVANNRARSPQELETYMRTMRERLSAIPGVTAVTAATPLPLSGGDSLARWGTEAAAADATKFQQGVFHIVLPGYFESMRTPVLAGRSFTEADNRPDVNVIIIDNLLAAKAFRGKPAVGQRILSRVRTEEPVSYEVIGVVAHQRHLTLAEDGREAMFFTDGYFNHGVAGRWAVRTSGDPSSLTPSVRSTVASVDARLIITELQPMDALVDQAMAPTRFALVLIGIFGAIAAILSMVGLYGVLATTVRHRTTEIGVRMAFGASRSSILKLVVGQGVGLSVTGIIAGLVVAIAVTRVMSSLLVGVSATDPLTFAAIAVGFASVAAIASWIPARRAAGLDPQAALRDE